MIKEIFKNYETFYNMVLSTTIMSNNQNYDLINDDKKIIDFIGQAHKFDQNFIDYCKKVITEDLIRLARTTDQQAIYNSRRFGEQYTDEDSLFDIKGDVLYILQDIGKDAMSPSSYNKAINPGWFDYSHYKSYQADVRFSKIDIAASTGNVIATRQVGILYSLGIGCKKNLDRAITRFKYCVYWGDISSMYYLGYVYALKGDLENSRNYYDLATICESYLYAGVTVLPDSIKKRYNETVINNYIYIASIKQDIIKTYNMTNIDFSFVEAILTESLDFHQRMNYINNYRDLNWKEITNSSAKTRKPIGFN